MDRDLAMALTTATSDDDEKCPDDVMKKIIKAYSKEKVRHIHTDRQTHTDRHTHTHTYVRAHSDHRTLSLCWNCAPLVGFSAWSDHFRTPLPPSCRILASPT
jgi:hypothetical protein